jgi:CPA2 family monovalent cation:H+ antiporter-2
MPPTHDASFLFIELGLVVVGLAVLARLASRWGFSAIPFYLVAGLAFGRGGLVPLRLTQNFADIGAEIGVLLLLAMNAILRVSSRHIRLPATTEG